jgi:hypothetical protein
VEYIYNGGDAQFFLNITDVNSGEVLLETAMPRSDLASYVGGSGTMMFAVGDLWNNSGHGAIAILDNIITKMVSSKTLSLVIIR